MELTKPLSVDVKDEFGDTYRGEFVFRTLLTRRQIMLADMVRRNILGPSPEGTEPLPNIHSDAFILGQLAARVVEAPKWWTDSDNGKDLASAAVITAVYDKALEAEELYKKSLSKEAGEASKKLKEKKKPTEVVADKDEEA